MGDVNAYAVALLDAPTHRHGPHGRPYVSYEDAVRTAHEVYDREVPMGDVLTVDEQKLVNERLDDEWARVHGARPKEPGCPVCIDIDRTAADLAVLSHGRMLVEVLGADTERNVRPILVLVSDSLKDTARRYGVRWEVIDQAPSFHVPGPVEPLPKDERAAQLRADYARQALATLTIENPERT